MAKSPLAKAGGTKNAGVICGLRRSPGKGMTTHSIILAWRILFTEEPGGYSPWGCKESDTTEHRQPSLVTSTLKLLIVFSGSL